MVLIGNFKNVDFGRFEDFIIEDSATFHTMIVRIIEDMDIMTYLITKVRNKSEIDVYLLEDVLRLLDQESKLPFENIPDDSIVSPGFIRDYLRAPLHHTDESVNLLSRFVNYLFIEMIRDAAARADLEERSEGIIKLRHILPTCEKWPWPLNRWC